MNERLNWMFPSLPVGPLFLTDVRISCWFLLVPLAIYPVHGIEVGLVMTLFLYLSVFFHEFAHVFVARRTGGIADEIHLTPLGGLAPVRPGHAPFATFLTTAAGPLVNLTICVCVFPGWYAPTTLWDTLNPLELPIVHLDKEHLLRDLGLLLFIANWIVLLVNLLPVMPLDGGQMTRAALSTKIHPELVHRTALQIGLGFALLLLMIGGAVFDKSLVVLIGAILLIINVVQLLHEELGEAMDDSSFGYDFSSAYDSLDSTNPTTTRQAIPSLLQRWRENRRLRREQRDRIRRIEAEQQLDLLLAKVHETGLQSLSDEEQKRLKSCSELLRPRPKMED